MISSVKDISIYLGEMEKYFVKPYGNWLKKQNISESVRLSNNIISKIKTDLDTIKPTNTPKEITIDNVVPPAQQKVFAEKLPDPHHSRPVKSYKEKVKVGKAKMPSEQEVRANPRSRSAVLRAAERVAA